VSEATAAIKLSRSTAFLSLKRRTIGVATNWNRTSSTMDGNVIRFVTVLTFTRSKHSLVIKVPTNGRSGKN
jgi:hypothetical protein